MTEVKRRILVVDDEADQRLLSWKGLKATMGAEVDCAATALEALVLIEERFYDLIVTDLDMPQMDGQTFFETVSRTHPSMPIIVQTGRPSLDSFRSSIKHSVLEYMGKPVSPVLLAQKIREILASREGGARPKTLTSAQTAFAHAEECVERLKLDESRFRGKAPSPADLETHWKNVDAMREAVAALKKAVGSGKPA